MHVHVLVFISRRYKLQVIIYFLIQCPLKLFVTVETCKRADYLRPEPRPYPKNDLKRKPGLKTRKVKLLQVGKKTYAINNNYFVKS